ncbi:hypothetical protein OPKNFCMD_1327 [Methylobacterium crusticola]|uniref:DUF2285 domain-containing protein n=1 Tax=Methylobacterium crusticola TaxID=1697972 RepID=A0ABQ4QV83_9HYPH|nr:hypothetical protein [Methylobacterium crusticola]GJD48604.1 hypothetical protein OPKNFCMD_1327 [Methylobacterium crusticola]
MADQRETSTFGRIFRHTEPTYRAYLLDESDKIVWAELIAARDDDDAVSFAHGMMENHAIELWDRARFITRLEVPTPRRAA